MRILKIYAVSMLLLSMTSCHGLLDIEPTNKITVKDLFSDPNGAKAYLATLYRGLPIEDYMYMPGTNDNGSAGFNNPKGNIGLFWLANISGEAIQSQWGEEGPGYLLRNDCFNKSYSNLRDINYFKSIIPTLEVSAADKTIYEGEAAYMTAYIYFYLAQKFGGVPLIKGMQDYDPLAPEKLVVPRSTEVDTWKYVLAQCDVAAANLPEQPKDRRASKWAALALKSRAALVAASVAKFGGNIKLTGEAVTKGLAGMPASDAAFFYDECIKASWDIMSNSGHELYKPTPANPAEAEKNFKSIFSNPNQAGTEPIFIKGIGKEGDGYASSLNYYTEPVQTQGAGRMSPTLNLVDVFETYEDKDGVRSDGRIVTRKNEDFSLGGFDKNFEYIKVDRTKPYQLFDGTAYGDPKLARDARLWASVILPGTKWKGLTIILQGGMIRKNGEEIYRVETTDTGKDGKEYHSLGGSNPDVSGFYPDGTHSMSGFLMRKMISEECLAQYDKTTTDYIVFRYAEILLNYAEAVVESGLGDAAEAKKVLNDIRKRAAHTNDIPLTRENVRNERCVELAFENLRVWDLKRWRIMHEHFTGTQYHSILVPMLDLREAEPCMIFVRKSSFGASLNGAKNYNEDEYYEDVPRDNTNNMIQNP